MNRTGRKFPGRDWVAGAAARPAWLALAGGLIFLAIFQWCYAGIDPQLYQYRDDGIITLSHARNWVEYGFIGINPSGERIEAYSAPLQMLLYAAAYGATHVGFESFMSLQTLLSTFGIGCLFALFFADRPVLVLPACAVGALVLSQLGAFMVWHGSGMENALTHVFLLWTVWILYRSARDGQVKLAWAVVPFLASITRIDGLFYVAPLLLVFCLWWHGARGDRQARNFTAAFGLLWLLFNLARYAYFGSALPNTAVAQGISVGERLLELFTLSPTYLDQSFGLARTIFARHGGYLLVLLLPLVVLRRQTDLFGLLLALAGTVILMALVSPFVFGPARLDTARTSSQLALFVVLAVVAPMQGGAPSRRADLYLVPLAAVLAFLAHEYTGSRPYMTCCGIGDFEQTRKTFARIGLEEGIARPTVANPDLGVVSWHKQFNIVDLGLLGSSLVARIEPGPVFNSYFLEHAAPDMIESHGWWTCRYASLWTDPRFASMYLPMAEPGKQTQPCKGFAAPVPTGFWVRRDAMRASRSAERIFMDALARDPSAERVARELVACQGQPLAAAAACTYVARSVFRVLPEMRARGEQGRLEDIFRGSRSADFDLFLVRGSRDGLAYRKALASLRSAAP